MSAAIRLVEAGKGFVLHEQGGLRLSVVDGVDLSVAPGECVVLGGPSGIGKSSILKMIYGNYRVDTGRVLINAGDTVWDMARAAPRQVLALRAQTVGYVSQFLRVIPRVATRDIVAAAAMEAGRTPTEAVHRAEELLGQLNVPARLWDLPPATFSGGEQQRVNIARGFAAAFPILLLDEPTASLDARNRAVVVDLIKERKAAGTALLGIFHDADVREALADRVVDVTGFSAAA